MMKKLFLIGVFFISSLAGLYLRPQKLGNTEYVFNPFTQNFDAINTATSTSASSTPGGSNTQIQVNENGTFAGYAGLTFTSSTGVLFVTTTVSIGTSTNPTLYALDIDMGGRDVRFVGNSIYGNGFITENTLSGQKWAIGTAGNSTILGPAGAFYFYDYNDNDLEMVLTDTGLLGLGQVSNPLARIHLPASTATSGGLLFGTDTNLYRSAANTLRINDNLTVSSTVTSTRLCLTGDSCITTWPTGGGGGSVSTSTSETVNYFPYWTSTAGSPATLAGTSTLYQLNGNIGVGTTTPLKALQVAGEVNTITSVTRRTNVGFSGLDSANNAAFPRAFFYGYSGSAITNFGFYAASGDATGSTQTPAFLGVSTNADVKQASSVQALNYLETSKYVIYTTQAENTQRAVPIYIGHFTQPDITVATNTFIGLGNVTAPTARLSLAASTIVSGGIAFGTDTNLYRSAADTLRTDDSFIIGSGLNVTGLSTLAGLSVQSIDLAGVVTRSVASSTFTSTGDADALNNAGYSTAQGDFVYLSPSSTWKKTNANSTSTSMGMIGVALQAVATSSPLLVATKGSLIRNNSWNFAAGATIYLSTVDGTPTTTAPTSTNHVIRVMGWARNTTTIYFSPSEDYLTLN